MVSISEFTSKLRNRELTAVEAVSVYLTAIEKSSLNTFITPTPLLALAAAKEMDAKLARGESVGALAGVPLAVKDIIVTRGIRSTGASRILDTYVPPYDATVVERLLAEGAIILGKTNCDEFAMGASGENSGYGPTRNPWDVSCVPGGSSSGSAAAVAAGECLVALGTDTGGSVRQPAAFCGVVGLKPTYGRVSRWGLMAMTSSFDQAGPLTRSVEDAARMLKVMAGHDERDSTSSREPVPDYVAELQGEVQGLRLGVPKEFFADGLEPDIRQAVETAITKLKELGVTIVEVSLPSMPYALAAYYVICPAEVSANLARYDGIRFGSRQEATTLYDLYAKTRGALLGAEVRRRIMLGTYVLSSGYYEAYYRKAQQARRAIRQDFARVFEQVDALVAPTTPTAAFALGSKADDPLAMYLADVYTVPVNIAGLPALSVPCGFTKQGLPIGLQLMGPAWSEARLLRIAHHYEQATPWHERLPVRQAGQPGL
ncbi:MAG: Asp-tRNA(Asn)/Glu-tRNA(Gln) amidotransferase subunit GatA [Candidatus Veblenbacteria bacterium]|nr:Asp-tRNA(Asn)/Glu-tRNA(Gln) amidotransferase subunit GatA [Candidatus Veblenbacteria bacterium]